MFADNTTFYTPIFSVLEHMRKKVEDVSNKSEFKQNTVILCKFSQASRDPDLALR